MGHSDQANDATSTPLLDDQPSRVDLLNFGQFVEALEAVIRNPQTKTPIIMGVFGRWGTGKSTLMRMLQERVEQQGMTTVWFNAWLYNKEDEIWAALLQSLTATLSRRLGLLQKIRFAFGVHDRGMDTARLMYVAPGAVAAGLGVALVCLVTYLLSQLFPTEAVRTVTQVGGVGASRTALDPPPLKERGEAIGTGRHALQGRPLDPFATNGFPVVDALVRFLGREPS